MRQATVPGSKEFQGLVSVDDEQTGFRVPGLFLEI